MPLFTVGERVDAPCYRDGEGVGATLIECGAATC